MKFLLKCLTGLALSAMVFGSFGCDSHDFGKVKQTVNRAPTITLSAPTAATENILYTYSPTCTDADNPAQTLTLTVGGSDTCGGGIAAGTYSFTPTELQGGTTCDVEIVCTDDGAGLLSATEGPVTVTINEDNQAPTITSSAGTSATENALYSYAITCTDADNPAQTLTLTVGGNDTCGGGIAAGTYSFTPTELQGGTTCDVEIVCTDDGAGLLSATEGPVTVTINEDNQAPTITSGAPTAATENILYTYSPTCTDADNPAQTLTLTVGGSDTCGGGIAAGTYSFTPTELQGGTTCDVEIVCTDDGAGLLSATEGPVTVTIAEDNQAPTITLSAPTAATENILYTYSPTCTDADNPAQTLTLTVGGSDTCGGGIAAGTYSFTPTELQGGTTCDVEIVCTDDSAGLLSATEGPVTVTINEDNQAPTITSSATTAATENILYTYSPTCTDADNPAQTLTLTVGGSDTCGGGIAAGTYSFTPTELQGGTTCDVEIVCTDDGAGLLSATEGPVTVTIAEDNQAPTITLSAGTAATENILYTYSPTCTDADNPAQTLTLTVGGNDTCGGGIAAGTYSFTPTELQGGTTCDVEIVCTDDGAGLLSATEGPVTVTIAEDNQTPTITNLPATEAGPVTKSDSFTATATDADLPAQTLAWSLGVDTCTFAPTVVPLTGVVSWTCGDIAETCTAPVTVTDTLLLSDTQTLTIDCNTAPTLAGTYDTTGSAWGVYVSGGYAYVADGGPGLQVIDISTPASPTLVGTYNTTDRAIDVYVSGGYAYVADYGSGLQVIDVSTPASPTLVGTYDTPDFAYGVYVSGGYAYVADGGSGLQVIDISTPVSPTLVGTYDTAGFATDVYVSGGYAYVADYGSGLQVIDVSTPASPTLVGTYDTAGFAWDVYVSGGYAYVADGASGLLVIDVSTPVFPTLVGTYDTASFATDVYVSGGYAYVADDTSGLQVIDVSTPASPTLVGTYDTPGLAWGVYVSGGYAYVGDDTSGLQVIQVSYPISAPTLAGTYDTTDWAWGVHVSGGYAYVADGISGLQVIDISNPVLPTLAGTYDTTGSARGVYVSGGYAYVADGGAGLQVIDVSTPAFPTLAGTYDTTGLAQGVYVSGGYAYVADGFSGLQVIDVSNPAFPTLAGTYDTTGNAYGVYVSGGYAYVADEVRGLQIIDVSNPAFPTLAGTYDTTGWAFAVYVSGGYAYVADLTSGLQIIDVSNPAFPTLAGTYNTPDWARDVYVSGGYAYVADYGSGLQIIDVSTPASPTLVGTYDTTGLAWGVYVSGGYAYVGDSRSGLQVIQVSTP